MFNISKDNEPFARHLEKNNKLFESKSKREI